MKTISKNLVASRHLTAAFTLAALAVSGCASLAQPADPAPVRITPAQWLQRQPKPVFKPSHTMPRLTRYAYDLDVETFKELAGDWNYVVQTNYLSDEAVTRANDPNEERYGKLVALTLSNPKKYPLGVVLDRSEPPNPAPETFLRGADGQLLSGSTYSPLNPQSTLDQMAELRARPLRELRKKVPINMVLNGGEYGLGVLGFMQKYAEQDPKVVAAKNKSGLDWFTFMSKAKGREMDTIAEAVRKAVPDRSLYIYYATGPGGQNLPNKYGTWKDWGMDPQDALKGSDLPSTEYYYKHFNTGYIPDETRNDLLTRALNAVGFQVLNGQKLSYDWLCAGWEDEADPNAPPAAAPPVAAPAAPPTPALDGVGTPQLQEGNAAALVDPNAGVLSPMTLYTGFLKCIFTAGTIGGNAGYYALPGGGFNGTFPADKPKNYLPQMTALSHVQALFSHLESDVRNSDLLPGPNKHAITKAQAAYEFPTGDKALRVLARKSSTRNKWLITAWAADGKDRPVTVTIPELGKVTLWAREAGSVYTATLKKKRVQLMWNDANAMTPTVKGFAPQKVTEAQIKASVATP